MLSNSITFRLCFGLLCCSLVARDPPLKVTNQYVSSAFQIQRFSKIRRIESNRFDEFDKTKSGPNRVEMISQISNN